MENKLQTICKQCSNVLLCSSQFGVVFNKLSGQDPLVLIEGSGDLLLAIKFS